MDPWLHYLLGGDFSKPIFHPLIQHSLTDEDGKMQTGKSCPCPEGWLCGPLKNTRGTGAKKSCTAPSTEQMVRACHLLLLAHPGGKIPTCKLNWHKTQSAHPTSGPYGEVVKSRTKESHRSQCKFWLPSTLAMLFAEIT